MGLNVDGDPYYEGRSIEELCQQLLGHAPVRTTDKVKISGPSTCYGSKTQFVGSWLRMRQMSGYCSTLILGGMLFPYASDSLVHMRWLSLLEELDLCGQLSWGSINLDGYAGLLLSWAYHRIPSCQPFGFDQCQIPLMERWVGHEPYNDIGRPKFDLGDGVPSVVCCNRRVASGESCDEYIPSKPLDITKLHGHAGRTGRGEWFPHFLGGWCEMWDGRLNHVLLLHYAFDLRPSQRWYFRWAHLILLIQGNQVDAMFGHVPDDLTIDFPPPPDLHQPEDSDLSQVQPRGGGHGRERDRRAARGCR
ncbi:hypothetical protein Ahy_B10g101698 [Arachis hypogaea]|uniref:Aminotransferase-like plant mobile domain-containing protein n=1 Tax=Arachis hypogaea TaxID=3818 RepID=A0A444X045_ARAHY|nr:hypothetical protein Ahy_B10g101698 [Arachis hypogaea]